MKRRVLRIIFLLIIILAVETFAQKSKSMTASGILESSVSANAGAGDANPVSYGLEEYANIRMQANVGENATFFSAINLIAAAGDYAAQMAALESQLMFSNMNIGKNYAALIELERLYLKMKTEKVNFDAGLIRLPLGFSNVWGSSDFLNPKNPIKPDARPCAVLGGAISWFPIDEFKFQSFAVSGDDPLEGNSGIAGISTEKHWKKASVQALLTMEHSEKYPSTASSPWTPRFGMSAKADLELGLVVDMLYAYNKELEKKKDGLSLSAGFDYSVFKSKLIILAEYLFNGTASSTSLTGGGSFSNENYLYTGLTLRLNNDFTNAGLALISGLDDTSFISLITFEHQISQGIYLNIMAQVPMDKNLFNDDGNYGEFGPRPFGVSAGSYFNLQTKIKVRF